MEIPIYMYVLRALTNILLALLNTVFIRSVLTPKDRFSNKQILLGTFAVTMTHLILNMFLFDYLMFKFFFASIFLALGTGIFYQDRFIRRVGTGMTFMFLTILSEGTYAAALAWIYGESCIMTRGHAEIIAQSLPIVLCSMTFYFGGASLIFWQRRKKGQAIYLDRFFILPLSQMVTMVAFLFSMYVDSGTVGMWDAVVTLIALALCVVTDIVFLRIVDAFVLQKQREEQQKLQKRHYAAMMEQQNRVRKMRHDIANHLMTIEAMVSRGDPGAQEYSQRLMRDVQETPLADWCDNQVVNAVLYSKASEAAAANITFQVDAQLSEDAGIDELDLMSLLSNLLDNALTAAAQAEPKTVSLKIWENAGEVVFQVRNTIDPQTVPDLQKTSKRDKASHGLGVGIIKDICSQYHGTFTTAQKEDQFEVSVTLFLPSGGQ